MIVDLRVGTLHVSLIYIRVNLVGPFMLYFRLSMKASVVIVIILERVDVILRGVYLLGIIAVLIILDR